MLDEVLFPKDGQQRSYCVLWHLREGVNGPAGQQYNLDVRATNVQRAVAKVIAEQVGGDYGNVKRDIVIDEVTYNEPGNPILRFLERHQTGHIKIA